MILDSYGSREENFSTKGYPEVYPGKPLVMAPAPN